MDIMPYPGVFRTYCNSNAAVPRCIYCCFCNWNYCTLRCTAALFYSSFQEQRLSIFVVTIIIIDATAFWYYYYGSLSCTQFLLLRKNIVVAIYAAASLYYCCKKVSVIGAVLDTFVLAIYCCCSCCWCSFYFDRRTASSLARTFIELVSIIQSMRLPAELIVDFAIGAILVRSYVKCCYDWCCCGTDCFRNFYYCYNGTVLLMIDFILANKSPVLLAFGGALQLTSHISCPASFEP